VISSVKSKSGFTLIETILTLAILGILVVLIFSSVRLGLRSWEKGEAVVESASSVRFVFSRLSRDVGSMYLYRQKKGNTVHNFFIGGNNRLGFVTTVVDGVSGLPFGGAKWVFYSVSEKGLTVREKIVLSFNITEDEGGRIIVLDTDVTGVSFEYKRDDGWAQSWNVDQEDGLPRAIRITLTFKDKRSTDVYLIPVGTALLGAL